MFMSVSYSLQTVYRVPTTTMKPPVSSTPQTTMTAAMTDVPRSFLARRGLTQQKHRSLAIIADSSCDVGSNPIRPDDMTSHLALRLLLQRTNGAHGYSIRGEGIRRVLLSYSSISRTHARAQTHRHFHLFQPLPGLPLSSAPSCQGEAGKANVSRLPRTSWPVMTEGGRVEGR